jgi:ubiquinol oxidase
MHERREPADVRDRLALASARAVHRAADAWFGPRMTHRTLVLEALAGVPPSVLAIVRHLRSMRRMRFDLLVPQAVSQASHEQAHLMVFASLVRPTTLERVLLWLGQTIGVIVFTTLALCDERVAHRLAAYFEEEALESYDEYLAALSDGRVPSPRIPPWAARRWQLPPSADLRALVPAIQRDEAEHRDEHHAAADALARRTRTRRPEGSKRRVFI